MTVVPVTSADLDGAEVSWFAALCSDDYQFLGVPDGALRSSWEHCSDIVQKAEQLGFRNILCPSSYQVGQDTLSFVAGCAPITERINMLAAIRCGEMQPIMLARTVATLDHMLKGRLTLNVISSDFPGEVADSAFVAMLCRGEAELSPCLLAEVKDRLAPFTTTGLARLEGNRLAILSGGLPYARVIAAMFDSYRAANQRSFSSAI